MHRLSCPHAGQTFKRSSSSSILAWMLALTDGGTITVLAVVDIAVLATVLIKGHPSLFPGITLALFTARTLKGGLTGTTR